MEYFYCIIFVLLLLTQQFHSQILPTFEVDTAVGLEFARRASTHLSIVLKEIGRKNTNYHKIIEEFRKLNETISKESLQGEELLEEFKNGVEKLFDERTKVLHEIKTNAENIKSKYVVNNNIEMYDYHNMRDIDASDNETLAIVPSFSETVPVNLEYSFVQVPTNIYSGKKSVLNTVTWTEKLDPTFIGNFENSSGKLLYQYYGDSSGLFRIYPGSKNGNDGTTDLFDCRRRIWYIQATSSPKDIVIVIDTSGSMIGNNIGIAKITAASLIDTLQENDYFNVITVNKEVTYIIPCVKFLIQATKENKETMKFAVQKIDTPTDIVDINLGMEKAFDILQSGTFYNRTYADCNQAIMFITDGVEGEYAGKDVFEKRNKDKTVRAFAYLVGRYKSPDKQALVDMACNNRGYFYSIETLGNVWDTVLEYIKVFSRPIAIATAKPKPSYTPVYLDSTGLGMVMSVSLGVFIEKEFVGVAGTDIPLAAIQENIPNGKLGLFSHVFVVNNNGFILLHPKFRDQTGYLPAAPNVYMEDLERGMDPNRTLELKMDMIKQESGEDKFSTYWTYDGDRRIMFTNTTYFYTSINNTDFSAAVAILEPDESYFNINDKGANLWISQGIEALYVPVINKTENYTAENYTYVQISPWRYCNVTTGDKYPQSLHIYPTVNEVYEYLSEVKTVDEIPSGCDKMLVKKLLTTAGIVNELVREPWSKVDKKLIESLFVATTGGYSRYLTYTNTSKPFNRDVYKVGIVEMAAADANAEVIVSAPARAENDHSDEPILLTMGGVVRVNEMLAAVSGMKVSSNVLEEVLKNASTLATSIVPVNPAFPLNVYSSNDTYICAILDYNGYIIASNQGNKYTGRFIGEVVGKLIEHLANVNISIFTKLVLNDTQAECPIPDKYDSASSVLLTPAKLIFNFMKLLFTSGYWVTMQIYVYFSTVLQNHHIVYSQTIKKINVSCTKETPFYVFNQTRWAEHENIKVNDRKYTRKVPCGKCELKYAISEIEGTNLIFLIADVPCLECRQYKVRTTPVKKEDPGICTTQPKYRRRPDNCFNSTRADIDGAKCGRAGMEKPTLFLLLSCALIGLMISGVNT